MKILALDLGDVWVGSALADALGITCRPYKTVQLPELEDFLTNVIAQENVSTIVVGYPMTMSGGTESEQTVKVRELKEKLEKQFTNITWILWDERLSSKRADTLKGSGRTKEEKARQHSVAASFILQTYLDFKAIQG